jgi:drug/metabolite transporter (DMT)-like permease
MDNNTKVKAVANKRRRPRRHKVAFLIGMCLGMMGLLVVLGADLTAFGQGRGPTFPIAAHIGGMNYSEELGFLMIIGASVMFGIAWHLAGKQVGVDTV